RSGRHDGRRPAGGGIQEGETETPAGEPMTPVEDRIRGSLLGLAWGDVFGCPVEGWRSGQIQAVYGTYGRLPDAYPLERIATRGPKTALRLRPLGLHSDDTQQGLALLHVCLAPGGWSKEAWAALLVEGMRRQAWRGYGRNFSAAVAKLARGVPPEQAGSPSAGIGAVMRIGPVGALFRDDAEALARVGVGAGPGPPRGPRPRGTGAAGRLPARPL